MTAAPVSEQDYIPGTAVIKNLVDRGPDQPYGTPDQRRLDAVETFLVSTRMAELLTERPAEAERFTFSRMREIHRHLFQDVYAWAGEPRRVGMAKLGTAYADPREMRSLLRGQYEKLAAKDYLRGIADQDEFASELAESWAEINHGHAFREGNTRSQTVFFLHLARSAGWTLDVARFSPDHPRSIYDDFVRARFEHQAARAADGSNASVAAARLARVLRRVVSPDPSPQGIARRAVRVAPRTTVAERRRRFPELHAVEVDESVNAALQPLSGGLER